MNVGPCSHILALKEKTKDWTRRIEARLFAPGRLAQTLVTPAKHMRRGERKTHSQLEKKNRL